MHMRTWILSCAVAVVACGGDDSGESTTFGSMSTTVGTTASTMTTTTVGTTDEGSSSGSSSGDGSAETSSDPSTTMSTTDPTAESTGAPVDCTAPTDCDTCWQCAVEGPCSAAYMGCVSQFNCSPTLSCIEDACPQEGLTQVCADQCCFSCEMLGTCDGVNAATACVAQQCAGLCEMPSC